MSKSDMLYIGIDEVGRDERVRAEVSTTKLVWNKGMRWWSPEDSDHETSSSMHGDELNALKRLLNLDHWPAVGEVLVYNFDTEEADIIPYQLM